MYLKYTNLKDLEQMRSLWQYNVLTNVKVTVDNIIAYLLILKGFNFIHSFLGGVQFSRTKLKY